jgi:hypothetical protein
MVTQAMPVETRFTPYSIIGDYIEYALLAFSLLLLPAIWVYRKLAQSPNI